MNLCLTLCLCILHSTYSIISIYLSIHLNTYPLLHTYIHTIYDCRRLSFVDRASLMACRSGSSLTKATWA